MLPMRVVAWPMLPGGCSFSRSCGGRSFALRPISSASFVAGPHHRKLLLAAQADVALLRRGLEVAQRLHRSHNRVVKRAQRGLGACVDGRWRPRPCASHRLTCRSWPARFSPASAPQPAGLPSCVSFIFRVGRGQCSLRVRCGSTASPLCIRSMGCCISMRGGG